MGDSMLVEKLQGNKDLNYQQLLNVQRNLRVYLIRTYKSRYIAVMIADDFPDEKDQWLVPVSSAMSRFFEFHSQPYSAVSSKPNPKGRISGGSKKS